MSRRSTRRLVALTLSLVAACLKYRSRNLSVNCATTIVAAANSRILIKMPIGELESNRLFRSVRVLCNLSGRRMLAFWVIILPVFALLSV